MQAPRSFTVADTIVRFPLDSESGRIGLTLVPAALAGKVVPPRPGLAGLPYVDAIPGVRNPPARLIDPLAQIKILGDPYSPAFSQGHTMRNSPSTDAFRFAGQETGRDGDLTTVLTVLEHPRNYRIEHRLSWHEGDEAFAVRTSFINGSAEPVALEMLSSFALGDITPFHAEDAPGRLRVHRFRSVWSAEGRLETRSIEELHLERSWINGGIFSERFGQVGSMPVRKWFPFAAIEDVEAGVTWGAQLAWTGSWQMEILRQRDDVSLSGGLADREFGHWMKTVAPGERLDAPPAMIACVQGGLDELCDRLTALHERAVDAHPTAEHDLPIVFNEYCTTWGDPQHDQIVAIADRIAGSPARYLVIDAGWYKADGAKWDGGHGDWQPNARLFPQGLAATAQAIRDRGLIPGIWFEMETVGHQSSAFSLVDHLLARDGFPLTTRGRRFWNLHDPAARAYLTERVIDLLESCGFGYLKVDYNETIGLGSDHPDGLGEGLRQQTLGTYWLFEKIRERLPHIVIENCASGGHRLEPSMLARTAMSSFSDAHELVEIPIIAANLHRLLLPRQSQVWAVLHAADSDRRLIYSLAATFLGRMCLSGDILDLSPAQWEFVQRAQELYRGAASIIKHGTSRLFGEVGASWRHPRGWQAVRRVAADGESILVVAHAFADAPGEIELPLPRGSWNVGSELAEVGAKVGDGKLTIRFPAEFSACVAVLDRQHDQ